MDIKKAKAFLEYLYLKYNTVEYIQTDPIAFLRSAKPEKQVQEFVAFTAAMFAYGNVKAMQGFLQGFFTSCGTDPLKLKANPKKLKYRFQSAEDVASYCKIMKKVYLEHESLEPLFAGATPAEAGLAGMTALRAYFPELTHGIGFLLAMPGKSASKRLTMFLRWMIRSDAVDLGLWQNLKPEQLSMPLDVHIQRFAEKCGIITSSDKGAKALQKVDAFFKMLNPQDPAKYDFALARLGIAFNCKYSLDLACKSCEEREICLFN